MGKFKMQRPSALLPASEGNTYSSQMVGTSLTPIYKVTPTKYALRSPCRPGKLSQLQGTVSIPAAYSSISNHLPSIGPFILLQPHKHALFLSCSCPLRVGGREQKQGNREELNLLPSLQVQRLFRHKVHSPRSRNQASSTLVS